MSTKDLSQLLITLSEAMDNPLCQTIRESLINALGIYYPQISVGANAINSFLANYNAFKLNELLNGLSSNQNSETYLNKLNTYVKSSHQNAIRVADLFRKTIDAESPKACYLYGLILGKHLDKKTEFTPDELIVCRALQNANKYDLKNFLKIMQDYCQPDAPDTEGRIVFLDGFCHIDEFNTTCDWCVYNRLFIRKILECNSEEEAGIPTDYYAVKPATVLKEYLLDVEHMENYRELSEKNITCK